MPPAPRFDLALHLSYLKALASKALSDGETLSGLILQHLKISGVYWTVGAAALLHPDPVSALALPEDELSALVTGCCSSQGGAGGNVGLDPHVLYTLSTLQVIKQCSVPVPTEGLFRYLHARILPDGSVQGDSWNEIDTRFSYCVLNGLTLAAQVDRISPEQRSTMIAWLRACRNPDGAFGREPKAESHAGQTFCAVGALALLNALDEGLDGDEGRDRLAHWLVERQLPEGGLNGRPEKLPDVCYSWWVLSALASIDRIHWLDRRALGLWILQCVDPDEGGFADRPGDMADVYHTFFALGGLSLLGYGPELGFVDEIDPALALNRTLVLEAGIDTAPWDAYRSRPAPPPLAIEVTK